MNASKKVLPTQRNKTPKVPKGFVMVNLATWQQKELRNLANECGIDLRGVLRWALTEVRSKLKERAELKRKTGLNVIEMERLLCLNSKGN